MKLTAEEHQAIKTVIGLGEKYGYGNLMAHLGSAWAIMLVDGGMPEVDAMQSVSGRDCYPLPLHRDIVERGEWDETGKRYRKRKAKR